MKILLAENDAPSRELLSSMLARWGYVVEAVTSGGEAWAALQKEEGPRLAILSSGLAEQGGLEVCREVRKNEGLPYIYLLVLVDGAAPIDLQTAVEAGADDYLTRPIIEEQVKARMRAGRRILGLRHELYEAQAALNYQVSHDALTGLMNRAAILDALRRELARVRREKSPVGAIKVQIDNFKEINREFGSVAGDAVLRGAARKLRSATRPYDSVGRFGTEDFLILVPGSDIREALAQAERLRVAVVTEPIEISEWGRHAAANQGRVAVTVSLGVAASSQAQDAERLVRAAEAALARARAAGPNRVEMATAEELGAS